MAEQNFVPVAGIAGAVGVCAGIGWAGSQHGVDVAGWPVFALAGVLALGTQWLVFVHAWRKRTEKYFDLTGSLTYAVVILGALLLSQAWDLRSVLIAVLVVVWAARLGSFLFKRVSAAGEDKRFRSLKASFGLFLMTWTLQGLWVYVTASCALAAITSGHKMPADGWLWLGLGLWLFGFAVEVIADRQKSAFRSIEANQDKFISHGLWAWSRHPNYFGEITLWTGMAVIALPNLQGWQFLTLISPLFVLVQLTLISGVSMLERRAEKQWGDDPEYQAYKRRTPALMLWPWAAKNG